jgi:hypothetical protein
MQRAALLTGSTVDPSEIFSASSHVSERPVAFGRVCSRLSLRPHKSHPAVRVRPGSYCEKSI